MGWAPDLWLASYVKIEIRESFWAVPNPAIPDELHVQREKKHGAHAEEQETNWASFQQRYQGFSAWRYSHKEKTNAGDQVPSWFLQASCCGPSLFGLGMFLFMSTRGRYLAKTWKKGAELWAAVFHTKMGILCLESAQRRLELLLITLQSVLMLTA